LTIDKRIERFPEGANIELAAKPAQEGHIIDRAVGREPVEVPQALSAE